MMKQLGFNDPETIERIKNLISSFGGVPDSFESDLILQLIQNSLRLLTEGHDTGQLKLITRAMKEMRYAYRTFNQYKEFPRISIFGSARTPEDHPDYLFAKEFSKKMAEMGWMVITGGANGIMKAGLEGPSKESGFGLSIRLPFESPSNPIIEGDPKLIIFRYFFTRKLMFMSHSSAVAVFPGGVGTMDELFEVLTLMQTGKAPIVPVVLMEGEEGGYWKRWDSYVKNNLLDKGWISPEDEHFWYIAKTPSDGADHIAQFYRRYHSSRYVKDDLVIRLNQDIFADHLVEINRRFSGLVVSGTIRSVAPYPEEEEFLDKPRIAFHHTRKGFGELRLLIDALNTLD